MSASRTPTQSKPPLFGKRGTGGRPRYVFTADGLKVVAEVRARARRILARGAEARHLREALDHARHVRKAMNAAATAGGQSGLRSRAKKVAAAVEGELVMALHRLMDDDDGFPTNAAETLHDIQGWLLRERGFPRKLVGQAVAAGCNTEKLDLLHPREAETDEALAAEQADRRVELELEPYRTEAQELDDAINAKLHKRAAQGLDGGLAGLDRPAEERASEISRLARLKKAVSRPKREPL